MYWIYFLQWGAGLDIGNRKIKTLRLPLKESVSLMALITFQYVLLQKSLQWSFYFWYLTAFDFPNPSEIHPLYHFRNKGILYQELKEYMGVWWKRAGGIVSWPHSPLPPTFCWDSLLATGSIWCVRLHGRKQGGEGWRVALEGQTEDMAQYWTSVWGS